LSGLLLGRELARQLGVAPGDVVSVVSPLGTPGPAGMVPRVKRFVVAGLFDSGLYDYDTTLAYMAVPDAQRFFDLHDGITGIEVRKSMGGSNASIGRIFILNGAVIGVAGTLLGNLLGLGGCWLLAHYRFVELPKDVFLVTTLPVRMDAINFLVVATVSIGICVIAALSPARRAASLVPVEVIRYE